MTLNVGIGVTRALAIEEDVGVGGEYTRGIGLLEAAVDREER